MLDRLALLVHVRARAIAIVAAIAFVAAAAIGAGVNQRLDPYDASDQATESAKADAALEQAGYFGTDVVVLVRGVDPRSADGRARTDAIATQLKQDPDVTRVAGFTDSGSTDFV